MSFPTPSAKSRSRGNPERKLELSPRMSFSAADHAFMAHALQLAQRGLYSTTPNPRVGCVMVRNDHVIGEGWHEAAGQPHAEAGAMAAIVGAGSLAACQRRCPAIR